MSRTATDLASLMRLIEEAFPFTPDHYPNGDLSTSEKMLAFAVEHSHKHLSKSLGRIGAESEEYDHGGVMDEDKLKTAATKMVVSALNLARMLGMSAEDVALKIPEVLRPKS
jgi:hypothetical protein